jgi:hypothetical protein
MSLCVPSPPGINTTSAPLRNWHSVSPASTPPLRSPGALKLLARNEPPAIRCSVCSNPATQLCLQCMDERACGLCDACASQYDCGEEMLVPLINSPRTGVCGYFGPSVEP